MRTVTVLATLFLGLTTVLCGGTILRYLVLCLSNAPRVEEIRRLRQESLAVHHDGEE